MVSFFFRPSDIHVGGPIFYNGFFLLSFFFLFYLNGGPKDIVICSVFRQLRHLIANICCTKRDIDNQARTLESTKGLVHCPKMSQIYPPSLSQSIEHPLCVINVAPHNDSKWNGVGFVCSSDLKPNVKLQMLSRRAALSGNTLLLLPLFLVLVLFSDAILISRRQLGICRGWSISRPTKRSATDTDVRQYDWLVTVLDIGQRVACATWPSLPEENCGALTFDWSANRIFSRPVAFRCFCVSFSRCVSSSFSALHDCWREIKKNRPTQCHSVITSRAMEWRRH